MKSINEKLPDVGTTIFSVMSALAQEHKAINLSQGFPDYPIDSALMQAVVDAMQNGYNQYAPMPGMPALRSVLANKINRCYDVIIDSDTQVTITPGATYAIYMSLATILEPDDEVIILEPAYDSYIPNVKMLGAIPVCIALESPHYSINWQAVSKAISIRTKAIIINTPHNPTGYVWTKEDMDTLRDLVLKHDLYIVSDEVYEHITFDDHEHRSILLYPELLERSFVNFSFGKVFHATGWKLGYTISSPSLMKAYRKLHQFVGFSCNTPMQVALASYLESTASYEALPQFFQHKRDLFLELFSELPFTIHQAAGGSYFQIMSYERISSLPDKEFVVWLTKQYGVAAIPLSSFNHDGKDDRMIRFCFAKQDNTLMEAATRLKSLPCF